MLRLLHQSTVIQALQGNSIGVLFNVLLAELRANLDQCHMTRVVS